MRKIQISYKQRYLKYIVLLLLFYPLNILGAQGVISVKGQAMTIKQAIQLIEKNSNYTFFYNAADLKNTTNKNLNCEGTIEEVLKEVFKGSGITYMIKGNEIILKVNKEEATQQQPKKKRTVTGTVVDAENGDPVIGATVVVKGQKDGVITDLDGNFTIAISGSKAQLEFSYIGYRKKTVDVGDLGVINVKMESDNQLLSEVVVVGAGTQKKVSVTGSITSVKGLELKAPSSSLTTSFAGKLAGVISMTSTGEPGAASEFYIRGVSTFGGRATPLILLDDVEISTADLNNIPAETIESFSILKDASSTAIYGVRAANGVIVIKTKRGKTGAASISYSASLNVAEQVTYDKLELMNSKERVAVSREIFQRGLTASWTNNNIGYAGVLKQYLDKEISGDEFERRVAKLETTNTDWFDILFRNPFSHNHSISVSGGSEDIRYYTSLSYNSTKGTAVGNDSESYGANVGLDMTVTNKFRASFSLSGSHGTTKGFTIVNPYEYATKTNRAIAAYEDNGDLSYYQKESGYLFNIINERDESGTSNKTFSLNSNLNLNYDFTESLKFQMLGSVNIASVIGEAWATERTEYIAKIRWYDYGVYKAVDAEYKNSQLPVGGEYSQDENKSVSWNWRNSLSYDKVFNGKHALTTMLGVELSSTKNTGYSSTTYGYLKYRGKSFAQVPIVRTNPYGNTQSANELLEKFTRKITDKKTNQFGAYLTMNYAYDGKYVVNFSVRLDASNRFGRYANENFNPVWAGGLRWNVSRETWFNKQNIVSDLSLRFSYGYQRNMATNYSPSLIVKVPTGSASEITDQNTGDDLLEISSLPYEDLRWEKTSSYNYGVDMGLFQNKIRVGFEYYLKKGKDMITSLLVPREYGIENMPVNGGSMNNSGWELSVSFTPVRTKNFTWDMGLNTSKNNNKITEVGIQNLTWRTVVGGEYYKKGYPVSSFWAFDCEGIDQQTGYPIINLDVHDGSDPLNDPTAYMRYAGKLDPDFTGGLTMSFRYKQLSLSTNFYLQVGGKKFLMTAYESQTLPSEYENLSSELNNRWKPGDTNAKFPGLPDKNVVNSLLPDTKTYTNVYEMYNYSNVRVVNASSLKCNSIALNYSFPEQLAKRFGVKYISMGASMSNPFTIASKDFKGRDPEVATGAQPVTSSYSFNLSVTF